MKTTIPTERLSQITTRWSEILKANKANGGLSTCDDSIVNAQQQVLVRYGSCIYQYLLGATRDNSVAEELAQEFAFRFVRGDLKQVSPGKGRFRDYLKAVLRNLVNDYYRRKQRDNKRRFDFERETFAVDPFEMIEQEVIELWRSSILDETWCQLREFQNAKQNHYYTVLRHRAEHPDSNSKQIAIQLADILPFYVNSDWVRQNLRRARDKFCALLIFEVRKTLPSHACDEEVEAELADLRLLKYTINRMV